MIIWPLTPLSSFAHVLPPSVEWSARRGAEKPPDCVVPPAQCSDFESIFAAIRDSCPVVDSEWASVKFLPSLVTKTLAPGSVEPAWANPSATATQDVSSKQSMPLK